MLSIIKAPNPVLSQTVKKIFTIDKHIKDLIREMEETLAHTTDPEGVGLAAPQIGRNLSLFIAKPTPKAKVLVFINPVITKTNQGKERKGEKDKLEGCLSLPSIWGTVKRDQEITIDYLDEHNASHTRTFTGFLSTIIQHEIDHLEGTLFPKRVLEQNGKLYKSRKNKKGEDIFEEMEI